jgi:beta-barrel assembly-enhancing protease
MVQMMFKRSRTIAYACLAASILSTFPAHANSIDLPDIGTVAGATLTIDQELVYGDAYMRLMRSQQPIINDPVLTEYVNSLGHRLVSNAENVKTPFSFFVIRNDEINAFAFFGGHVAMHSGLFLHTNTESELASVLAHEISHVTQRHLARSMEDQANKSPAALAALAGSLLLAIAAPQAGMAALTATSAGQVQSQINYTRSNEKEADRFGIDVLEKAGLDPYAMPTFFGRLSDEYRYASTPPAMLLTHPLPESRITDSRARAQTYSHVTLTPSLSFHLARARVIARYTELDNASKLDWMNRREQKADKTIKQAYEYGKALVYLDNNETDKAKPIIESLLSHSPENHFYIDTATDLYIAEGDFKKAQNTLQSALEITPNNPVLTVNYANVFMQEKNYPEAIKILQRYTHDNPDDTIGWSMLIEANSYIDDQPEQLAAQAELFALKADWGKSIQYYTQASQLAELNSLQQARYDARIDQLIGQRDQFLALQQ